MKKYIKPNTEEIDVKLEQMIAASIGIVNENADVDTEGFYKDSRLLPFDFDDNSIVNNILGI